MRHGDFGSDDRGLSPEGVAALGFALTILMLAVVGAGLLQLDRGLQSNPPVLEASGQPVHPGETLDDQWVRLHHENGDAVDVVNMTITVWLPEHRKRSTLQNLPTSTVDQSDYDHNHIFTLGGGGIEGPLRADHGDGRWNAGETIGFRLTHRRVPLEPGQSVEVRITHTPTGTTILNRTLPVEARSAAE